MKNSKPIKNCMNCGKILPKKYVKYCNKVCEKELINKNKIKCLNCEKLIHPKKKYCNKVCFTEHRQINLKCENCGKDFHVNDAWRVKQGKVKYCSEECKKRRYKINSHYFDELDLEKLITLGQIITIGHIVDYRTLVFVSDLVTIECIGNKLGSTYEISTSTLGLYRLEVRSIWLVGRLVELGMLSNCLYQDVPDDLWEGIKRTHCYGMDEGINVFRSERSRISLWVRDKFGGEVVTRMYKDQSRGGIMVCEWVVVWK